MKKRVCALLLIPFFLFLARDVSALEEEKRLWQDEKIYFLMVDRFANGDRTNDYQVDRDNPTAYHGGDFQGIIQSLDYIKDMGFTAIWLTPVVDNEDGGYHGYWTKDFYEVEEHFGTKEELQKLVAEAHSRDIKVLLDFVVNHVGPNHPFVSDPTKKEWFHEESAIIDDQNQQNVENGWIFGLPDLAQENKEVEAYVIDAAKWWIQTFDIDGFRLDTVKHVPTSFWKTFSKEMKAEKESFYLLGEVWSENPEYLAPYTAIGMDGLVDFPLNQEMRAVFSEPDKPMDRLFAMWEYNKTFYRNPGQMGVFIDNHDMRRMTWEMTERDQFPGTRWKQIFTYMYTTPGVPIVYYGSEIALNGGEDPDNRRMMQFHTDEELIDTLRELSEIRAEEEPLRRGDMKLLAEEKGMAVFSRFTEKESIFVAINNTSETKTVAIPVNEIGENMSLKGMLSTETVNEVDGTYYITLDRETSQIFKPYENRGINLAYAAILVGIYVVFIVGVLFIKKNGRKRTTE